MQPMFRRSCTSGSKPRPRWTRVTHTQLDLVEFTLLKAYLSADRPEDVHRLLSVRRPGSTGIPVAGFAALH
jgi:hypothetical protein